MSTVEEAKHWRNTETGQTASLFGAVPWQGEQGAWTVESTGWTVAHPDGTRGLGRVPFATREEAQAWCDAHPNFSGMSR